MRGLATALLLAGWPAAGQQPATEQAPEAILETAPPSQQRVEVAGYWLTYQPPVVAQKRRSMREAVTYEFLAGSETILTAYFGPHARFQAPDRPKRQALEDAYNGLPAKTLAWGTTRRRFRETIVTLDSEGWAQAAHFSYRGVSAEGAALADQIIESIRAATAEE